MKWIACALLAHAAWAADAIPAWVIEAARQPVPSYGPAVTSAVLLQEERLTVDAEGNRTAVERGAIRILQASKEAVSAQRTYNSKSGRIRQFSGWLVTPDGKASPLKKELILDQAASSDQYAETRLKILECSSGTPPGSTFAYEVTEEERTIFTQYHYAFQDESPALVSRFVLTLPPGWEAKGVIFNRPGVEPAAGQNTWTWELRDLPPLEDEEYRPGAHALLPHLWVAYFPPAGNPAGLRPLKDWGSVSGWVSELVDPPAVVTDAIAAKSAELTRAAKTEIDKIRSIATFVQQTTYVSVQMNLTRGGGYTPNGADKVLQRNYGDCKDKATLMRALLKAAGIDSYMTTIYSGDRTVVRPEWASPMQFNHAIIAVRVGSEAQLPTVIEDAALGRLLIFDPTSEYTMLGDLPQEEQGSYALVLAGEKGSLLKMPLLPVSANRVETVVNAEVDADGGVKAKLLRTYHGQAASSMRSVHRSAPDALKKIFESSITRRLGGSTLTTVEGSDRPGDSQFEAAVQFSALRYAQSMQGRLLVLRPGALGATNDYGLPAKERKNPIRLRARSRSDVVSVVVPKGYAPDEVPDPVEISTTYGTYTAKWTVTEGLVRMEQQVTIADTLAPASEYAKVRAFLEMVHGAQQSPVVLIRR